MKGQRLFVRETKTDDTEAIAEFYRSESTDIAARVIQGAGVLGRLVGSIVAHMTWDLDENVAMITHIHVAKGFRRKRIGKSLLTEAVKIAREKSIARFTVRDDCPARDFFLRTGFAVDDGVLFLEVD